MNFVAPEFLYALGFLAIPILIHLFNFRRYKTVQFSQVQFLKSVKKQTQSTSQLKHFLVLLCRCLAIAALVIAFAQPIINRSTPTEIGKKGVVIYIDNSFSMQANAEVGSLLDLAKNKALAITEAYSAADQFQLHTNDFDGTQQRWLNKEAFIEQLQNVDFSPLFRDFVAINDRLNTLSNEKGLLLEKYLVTDLQTVSFNTFPTKDSSRYSVIPVQSQEKTNAWIDQVSSFQPFHLPQLNEKLDLKIRQVNQEEPKSFNGSLFLNDQLKTPFSVELDQDSVHQSIQYVNPNSQELLGQLVLKDYPVVFDDTFYFSYPMKEKIGVLHLYEGEVDNSVASLFKEDSLFAFNSSLFLQLDFSVFNQTSLIILEGVSSIPSGAAAALHQFVTNGGDLVFFPASDMNIASCNAFFQKLGFRAYQKQKTDTTSVRFINHSSKLFENVFEEKPQQINLPMVYEYWPIQQQQNSIAEPILSFGDGTDFLKKYTVNSGNVYLAATQLGEDQTNFGRHALFVPILYNMALQSVHPQDLSFTIGAQKITLHQLYQEESPLLLKKGAFELIPKQIYKENSVELFLKNELKEAGFYQIKRKDAVLQTIAFNFDRKESQLQLLKASDFQEKAALNGISIEIINSSNESLSNEIQSLNQGDVLWKYFVLLALIFIGLEILFLRILKG